MDVNKDELLTVEEVANALGYKEQTIRQWISDEKIAVVRIGGKSVRIPMTEVQRIEKEKNKVEVKPPKPQE